MTTLKTETPTFGIEVEAENCWTLTPILDWDIANDGSLRNGGVEFISPVIQSSTEAKKQLSIVLEQLKERNCSFSYRTGIHFHLGTFEPIQAKDIIKAYIPYERMLFSLFPERKNSNFCVPLLDSDYYLKSFFSNKDYQTLIETWGKYSALNLQPLTSLGTVEFRIPSSTWDTEKLFKIIDIAESVWLILKGIEPIVTPLDVDKLEAEVFLKSLDITQEDQQYINETEARIALGLSVDIDDEASIEDISTLEPNCLSYYLNNY